jgi:hypothetical protein
MSPIRRRSVASGMSRGFGSASGSRGFMDVWASIACRKLRCLAIICRTMFGSEVYGNEAVLSRELGVCLRTEAEQMQALVRLPNGSSKVFNGFSRSFNILGFGDYLDRPFNVVTAMVEQSIGNPRVS